MTHLHSFVAKRGYALVSFWHQFCGQERICTCQLRASVIWSREDTHLSVTGIRYLVQREYALVLPGSTNAENKNVKSMQDRLADREY
ncbi:hypothetical protein DPMN_014017 [Dreissena polymorpha]|uniref:Uncharacterized protein n=1 Tax=Dreissena polymorpha TaxID=45954 RepID=A0A9D4S465_DREPO|nr:hypothetical protein DPMN_014017 [Dreissena polymorpha]